MHDRHDRPWFSVAFALNHEHINQRFEIVVIVGSSSPLTEIRNGTAPVIPLVWQHLCFALDTESGKIRIVTNGILVSDDTVIPGLIKSTDVRPKNIQVFMLV